MPIITTITPAEFVSGEIFRVLDEVHQNPKREAAIAKMQAQIDTMRRNIYEAEQALDPYRNRLMISKYTEPTEVNPSTQTNEPRQLRSKP